MKVQKYYQLLGIKNFCIFFLPLIPKSNVIKLRIQELKVEY